MATSIFSNGAGYVGAKNVTTAGTAVALESKLYSVKSLTITAKDSNTGRIFYGASDVTSSTQRGLLPGDAVTITSEKYFLISEVFIDATVSGEGVDFIGAA